MEVTGRLFTHEEMDQCQVTTAGSCSTSSGMGEEVVVSHFKLKLNLDYNMFLLVSTVHTIVV